MKKTRFLSLLLVLVMLLGMVPTAWAAPAASAATIYDLLVSDLDAPIGLDSDPVFSWKMRSDVIGAAQTAYRVVVTDGETEVWDTGWVETRESVGIRYAGDALRSSTAYTVTVTVKDQDGAETAPVSTTFEMGLLEENAFADAKFISMGEAAATSNLPAYRRVLNIREGLVSAKLYTAGLGVYESYINGNRVGNRKGDQVIYDELKPGATEPLVRQYYNSYDITWMLQTGENVLSSVVTSGWWNGGISWGAKGEKTAYLAKLILTYADGTETVVTDTESWKVKDASAVQYADIFNGETYDARVDQSWMLPGFDDSAWYAPVENTEFSGILSAYSGNTAKVRADLERSALGLTVYEGAVGAYSGAYGRINVVRTYADDSEVVLNPGETLLVDFGQNFAGWECFTVKAPAGTKITVDHGEMLNDNNGEKSRGNDGPGGSIYDANYRSAKSLTTYYASGAEGGETYHPAFTWHGFRYAEFTADQTVTFTDIKGLVVTSAMEDMGWMETTNADLNQLISNARWGMYSNYLVSPMDCPQRNERAGWTGDAQVFAPTGIYLNNSKAFLTKFLEDMRDCQFPADRATLAGAFPCVAPITFRPSHLEHAGAIGWSDAGMLIPYYLYTMYGDISVVEEHWDAMKLHMDVFMESTDGNNGSTIFGDWLAYENNSTTDRMIAIAYYAWDALCMAEMAAALGKSEDEAHYLAVYEEEKALFQSKYVKEDGKLVNDHQGACLYALYMDLLPNEASVEAVTNQLVANIKRNGNCLQTGFLGTAIILDTLVKIDRPDLAYTILLQDQNPSWIYSIHQGATSMWERWNSYSKDVGFGDVSMNSFNHYAYGAVVGWMFRDMLGIQCDPKEPGFRHIILAPLPNQRLTGAEATYESAYGTIVSAMDYDEDSWNYSCTVPANTTATIRLPVEDVATLTYAESKGLTYTGYADGIATFEAVAGSYSFSTGYTVENYVKIDVDCEKAVSPAMMTAEVALNGEVVETALPALLTVKPGDKITASVEILNNVDYTFNGWTVGGAQVESLDYTVTGNDTITANILWNGYDNIAEAKSVTAEEANATWAAAHLTDGVLNHKGGTNGWSSPQVNTASGQTTFPETTAVIDLGKTGYFNRIHLYPRSDATIDGTVFNFPKAYTLSVSDDNKNWEVVYSTENGEAAPNAFTPVIIELDTRAAGRYVKFACTAINMIEPGHNTFVQLSELGLYNMGDASVTISARVDNGSAVPPVKADVRLGGETVAAALPASLTVAPGEVLTAAVTPRNSVDYTLGGWTINGKSYNTDTLEMAANDAEIYAELYWNGYDTLAGGAAVTADSHNNTSWDEVHLTDGILYHASGKNGWSSPVINTTGALNFDEIPVVIDLGESKTFDRFHLYPRTFDVSTLVNFPTAYTISVSDDNAAWTPVYTTESGDTPADIYTPAVVELEQAVSGRYVKLGITGVNAVEASNRVFAQISEFGVYNAGSVTANVSVNVDGGTGDVVPMTVAVNVNGSKKASALPATVAVERGDAVTGSVEIRNTVDYTFVDWTVNGKHTDTLSHRITGDAVITANVHWNGYDSLATGKTVTAGSHNDTGWDEVHLTDGILSHLGGNTGWCSKRVNTTGTTTFDEVTAVIDLEQSTTFDRIHLYPRTSAVDTVVNFPLAYTIYVSDDNAAWTPVYTTENGEVPTDKYVPAVINLPKKATGRYVKLGCTAINSVEGTSKNVYVQLSELGLYRVDTDTGCTVTVSADYGGKCVTSSTVSVAVNGQTVATKLPATLNVVEGDVITASMSIGNTVDYTMAGWSENGVSIADTADLTYTVTDDVALTANIAWNGYDNLAEGKTVTAPAYSSWYAKNLTDGVLNHLGGNNGWSSHRISMEGLTAFDEVAVVIDLEETTSFNRVHLYPRTFQLTSALNHPTAYTIAVSDDNETWKVVYSTENGAVPTNLYEPVVLELKTLAAGHYVKLGVTGINAVEDKNPITYIQLSELGLYYDETIQNVDGEAAAAVDALIAAIGEVTLESKTEIDAARAAYDALTDSQKELVETYNVLTAAEAAYAAAVQAAADQAAAAAAQQAIAAIGKVTKESAAAIEAARTAYDALTDDQKALVTNYAVLTAAEADFAVVSAEVTLNLTGPATVNVLDETAVYTVSAKGMKQIATVLLTMEIGEQLTDPEVTVTEEGWYVLYTVFENGVLTASVANNESYTGDCDIMTITTRTAGEAGTASVTITEAQLAAYVGVEDEAFVTAILENASVTTVVERNIYDLNKDGVVNLLDMTRAQRFYGSAEAAADFDKNGTVDVADLIVILNNFTEPI